ncbi:MAG: hypothetical protein JF628_14865 [Sphingomonas sp.]|nr:hypothetical protein [Sphingomonas sp.]
MAWTTPTPAELAADWIASRRRNADDTSGSWAQFLLMDFPEQEPDLTWDTIKLVVEAYPGPDFYAAAETEAQVVCGVLAAGPLEDLLCFHGHRFIERLEDEARCDPRMAWMLGGTWQSQMLDEIWKRVQLAADYSYWNRRAQP